MLGCFGVPAGLKDFIEDLAVLIDCPPQPLQLTTEQGPHVIQMPNIIRSCHLVMQGAGIGSAEF